MRAVRTNRGKGLTFPNGRGTILLHQPTTTTGNTMAFIVWLTVTITAAGFVLAAMDGMRN